MTQEAAKIRVLCVDDHPLVRKGIASILANETDMALIGEAENGRDAVEKFRQLKPDVTLMDLRMPLMDGIAAVEEIRRFAPEARVIALTSYDGDQHIYRALEAGIKGYLLKEMVHTDVLQAIRIVNGGGKYIPSSVAARLSESFPQTPLTSRELEVLAQMARGLSNKEIASKFGTATGTVKMQVQSILAKLGAEDRTQAVTIALRRGILDLE